MGKHRTNYTNYKSKYTEDEKVEEYIPEQEEIIEEKVEEDPKIVSAFVDIPDGKKLNVRSSKSFEFDPITQLSSMQEVIILEKDDPEWYKICTASGIEGYIQKKYAKLDITDR